MNDNDRTDDPLNWTNAEGGTDLLRLREELREQINNLQPPPVGLNAQEQLKQMIKAEYREKLWGESGEEIARRFGVDPDHPGRYQIRAIDFLLAERNKQKEAIAKALDDAKLYREKSDTECALLDRQARDVARLKEDKERLGREVSRLNDVINERRQELVTLQEKHANQGNTIKNLQGECEELAAQRDSVTSQLEQRDTTIRAMRQQLVMAQQRGDELAKRCEELARQISEGKDSFAAPGQPLASYWRTQYEKLSQEHAVVVRDLTAQANYYKEERNRLTQANATEPALQMQFFACEDIGGHRCIIDPDAVILAHWNLEYPDRLHCKLEDDTLIFAGNEAVRVWEHLLARPR